WQHERKGFFGLLGAIAICLVVGAAFRYLGRRSQGQLFRKEAMAVVGLSWILATVLGALPFVLSGASRAPGVPMTMIDAMFEAQSGFSTTGATVLTELESPELVPRSILFWRSSTHFLGGLGIIVLFVAILGQGSAGKALMRTEMPGPSHSTPQARMQHTAWILFLVYAGLNGSLAVLLFAQGLSPFDAVCHAFGTMATGGFSTYNASVGHFTTVSDLNGTAIEMTIVLFMLLAGTNFMLLYCLVILKPGRLLGDAEWRTYIAVILTATALVVGFGLYYGDFVEPYGTSDVAINGGAATNDDAYPAGRALRLGLFQVVSIMTTTGFCTDEFEKWNSFACGLLLLLMFIGGCAGSTGGGLKVIRHVLFAKILRLEVEQTFRPSVVRPVRLGGEVVEDQELRKNILVYFGLIVAIFVAGWMFTITFEPDSTWTDHGHRHEHKLRDAAGCVAATLNNIGPGLGVIGARQNYANFTPWTKSLFIVLMMLGRLEIFVILVLFVPAFWRSQ
ncbi:MAG: TrkH family potassium uptake protein, partial [Planctomycetota bacterium]